MSITVRMSDLLRTATKIPGPVAIEARTPSECLRNLTARFPVLGQWLHDEKGNLKPQIWLLVNGERVYSDELEKPLNDGDELRIIVAVLGG
ncbi:MAG: MoaD/ThiS family protein [Chloroflexi bacterium]|nr:MoaD/ThiS family protein [Chloroflexota bacterium]